MKKLFSLLLAALLLIFQSPFVAASSPQGNFVLSGGKYRVTDEADPYEKMDKIFYSLIIIPVKDQQIDFSTIRPVYVESGSQKFTSIVEFSMKGSYDKETGAINAVFSDRRNTSYERKSSAGMRTGSGTSEFSGKATGTIIDGQVVLSFEGQLSSKSVSEADNKAVDTYTNPGIAWTKKVQFGTSDWVQDEVPQEEPKIDENDSGARFSDLSGQIEMWCPPNEEAWDVVKMGVMIRVNCHIRTGEDSSAKISFSDMTTFDMKPESEIVIDTPPQKDSKMKLIAGNIWANVKKMIKDGTMENHMSQAVAGIKGTTYVLSEDGTTSTLKVIEGTVSFKSKTTNLEKTVNAGETLSATSVGLGEVSKFDVLAESVKWGKSDTNTEVKVQTQVDGDTNKSYLKYLVPLVIIVPLTLAALFVLKKFKAKD